MSLAHSFSVDLHGLRRYPLAGAEIVRMEKMRSKAPAR